MSGAPRQPPLSCPSFILVLESFQSTYSVPTMPIRVHSRHFMQLGGGVEGDEKGGVHDMACQAETLG